MTVVLCIVAGTKDDPKAVSATACVEAQRDSRCWCMKAVVALQAVGPELEPAEGDDANALSKKRKLREELSVLRARCTGYLRKRPSEQFGGPAIAAAAGKTVEQPLSSSVPLPLPPKVAPKSLKNIPENIPAPRADPPRTEIDQREDEHEAAIAAQENAAGSTRKEASNDSVRKTAGRLNPTTVERQAPAMSPPDGASTRAAQGVAENSAASSPPQVEPKKNWQQFQAEKDRLREIEETLEEPTPPPAICSGMDGKCRTALRVNNTTGLCQRCRNRVPGRNRKHLVPRVARAAGGARNAIAAGGPPVSIEPVIPPPGKRGPKADFKQSRARGRICSVEGCERVLADKTKGTKCAPCLKGVKPGSGWQPCANAPACPRMAQRWKGTICAWCRQGKKFHLVSKPKEQSMAKPNPLDSVTEADFKASFLKYGGNLNAVGKQFGAAGSTVKRRAAQLGLKLVGRKTQAAKAPNTPSHPPRALEADVQQPEPKYPGLPPVEQVPIGYAKKLHEYLRSQGITFEIKDSAA